MRVEQLSELNLHDSVVRSLSLDRRADAVALEIHLDYIVSYDDPKTVPAVLRFADCVALEAIVRCWIDSLESIGHGVTLSPDEAAEFVSRNHLLGNVPSDVRVHSIEMATTASRLELSCRRVELLITEGEL